jgi:hypothetical protein
MTCTHVLGLIDAGPFADYPRAHLEAAWQHARQCPTCGPALETATQLTADLHALAQPAPPPDLERVVLARVAQVDEKYAAPAGVVPGGNGLRVGDWSVWASAGGLMTASAIAGSMPAAGGMRILIESPTTQVMVLVAGLIVYVAGLFAPLGRKDRLSR